MLFLFYILPVVYASFTDESWNQASTTATQNTQVHDSHLWEQSAMKTLWLPWIQMQTPVVPCLRCEKHFWMVLVPLLKIQSGEIICHGYLGFLIEPVYNSFLVANSKQHHVFFIWNGPLVSIYSELLGRNMTKGWWFGLLNVKISLTSTGLE